ncbi:hypothetical protein AV521_36165 [Streptomyces sp. IMTB 2501]|nr:hypothetical protein AV521_36165 [Streptomyces sp. IMTB 2501]
MREHRWTFDELIAPTSLRKAVFRPDPLVGYLVGEPGAQELETRRMLSRALRPGAVLLDPDLLRGTHPDHFQLVNDTPRTADELVGPDAQDWQADAEAYVRGRRGDLLIAADYTSAADFALSAGRFARDGYRIHVVAPAGRRRRQPAEHLGRACPGGSAARRGYRAPHSGRARAGLPGRGRHRGGRGRRPKRQHGEGDRQRLPGARSRPAGCLRPCRRPASSPHRPGSRRFHAVQRALHQALPRLRDEIRGITAQAQPLMPAPWQARPVKHQAAARLPLPAADWLKRSAARGRSSCLHF